MSNNRIFSIILACASIIFFTGIASAEDSVDPPNLPVIVYGNVNIDGKPAPAGTAITAKVGINAAGATNVLTAGKYGDLANDRLPVSASADGVEVDFYVNDIKATTSPSFKYYSGDAGKLVRVDLNAVSPNSGNNGGNSGNSGASGTGGTGTMNKKTATSTAKQSEIQSNAPGTTTAKDITATDTTKAPSPQFEFYSILGIFVLLVIGAVVFIVLKKGGKI